MTVRVKRFPEYDVDLQFVTAPHTAQDTIRFYEGLDASDATRWLVYLDPTMDMAGYDVATIPKLKRTVAAKLEEVFGENPRPRVIVCSSPAAQDFFLRFWPDYRETGDVRPGMPGIVTSLEAAYDWLGLPNAARAAVGRAVCDLESWAQDVTRTKRTEAPNASPE